MVAVSMTVLWWELCVEVFLLGADGRGWRSFIIHGSFIQGNEEGHPVSAW